MSMGINGVSQVGAVAQYEASAVKSSEGKLSKKALWSEFIKYYWQAYDFALKSK